MGLALSRGVLASGGGTRTATRALPGSIGMKDMDEQFQRLVARCVALLGASSGSLAVIDEASKALVTLAACSQESSGPDWVVWRLHETIAGWVVGQRTPAVIEQTAADPRTQWLGCSAVRSLLCVPLLLEQQVLGALTLTSAVPGAFGTQHLNLLEPLIGLAALALSQARQLKAMSAQVQCQSVLLEAAQALSATSQVRQIYRLAVETIRRLIPCDEAVLFGYEASTQELCGMAGLGLQSAQLAERRIRLADPQSVSAWVARKRRPLLQSPGGRVFIGPTTGVLMSGQALALLSVPLVSQDRLWGVMTLTRLTPFSMGDLRAMLTLGSLVASALDHASRVAVA